MYTEFENKTISRAIEDLLGGSRIKQHAEGISAGRPAFSTWLAERAAINIADISLATVLPNKYRSTRASNAYRLPLVRRSCQYRGLITEDVTGAPSYPKAPTMLGRRACLNDDNSHQNLALYLSRPIVKRISPLGRR